MIVVLAPMESEAAALRGKMSGAASSVLGNMPVTVGKVSEREVALIQSGVGLVAAAAATMGAILTYRPTAVVNFGVAGGIGLSALTPFVAASTVQADMDTTCLGDKPGYLSDLNTVFLPLDTRIAKVLNRAAGKLAVLGTLASSDKFISGQAETAKLSKLFGAQCCDMEGAAVAHVCAMMNVPCGIFRTVSDGGDGIEFQRFAATAASQAADVFVRAVEAL